MKFIIQSITLLLFFITSSLIYSTPASAKVRIIERTKYYTVSGRTGRALSRSITRRGPKVRSVGHAIATTLTEVKIRNIKPGIRGRRCIIKSADVVVKLTYTYPRWRNQRRASKRLRSNWKKFMRQVRRHEAKHGSISKNYGKRLHRELKKFSGRVSKKCRDFGSRSLKRIRRLERRYLREHANFDRREGRASSRIRRLQRALLVTR